MAQHGVHGQQQRPGNESGLDDAVLHGLVLGDAPCPDVQRDDRAEVQRCQRVHGLVAVEHSLHGGQSGVLCAGGSVVCRQRVQQAPGKQRRDEQNQAGAEDAPQPFGELFRVERYQERRSEKYRRVDHLQPGAAAQQRHQHLERGAGRARDGQTRPDGQVDQNGEHPGKGRVHPPGKSVQVACLSHRRNAGDGQADGADCKACKGKPEVCPGLCAQMRREDQVARPEKHGKQRKADQKQITAGKFFHTQTPHFCAAPGRSSG